MPFNIISISIISSIIVCYSYIKLWHVFNNTKTPTGYGITLVFFLIFYAYLINFNIVYLTIYLLIAVISLIYWIDDYSYLSSIFRFLLQFLSGVLICIFLLINFEYEINTFSILFILVSGLLNIFLSNVINFYDGLDLNLATFLIILSFTIFFMLENQDSINRYALIIGGFTLGFIFFNLIPNNVFFGDSGCFVISSFITFIIIKSILISEISAIYLIIPLALPSFDVAYVVLLRVYKKESLLTRNYHHIYHKIENKFRSKAYLLPQVISATVLYFIAHLISPNNLNMFILYILVSLIFVSLIYLFIRKYI